MENLGPCKVQRASTAIVSQTVLSAHPVTHQIPQTEIPSLLLPAEKQVSVMLLLLCIKNLVSTTLTCAQASLSAGYRKKQVSRRDPLCWKSCLCRSTENLSRWQRYLSLTPAVPRDLCKPFWEPFGVQSSTGTGRLHPSEPGTQQSCCLWDHRATSFSTSQVAARQKGCAPFLSHKPLCVDCQSELARLSISA